MAMRRRALPRIAGRLEPKGWEGRGCGGDCGSSA